MLRIAFTSITALFALSFMLLLTGCGGAGAHQRDKNFFTSGDREADQRAGQRMAKSEQLKGEGHGAGDKDSTQKPSLYDRLGAQDGLTTLVNDFTTRMLADPRVNFTRKGITRGGFSFHRGNSMTWDASKANVDQFKKHMVQFLSLATGGPAHYDGKEMKQAHQNLHITNAEFDAAIGDLKASLDTLHIANQEQKELLSIVESTRTQVAEER